jgi:hypothetical protein
MKTDLPQSFRRLQRFLDAKKEFSISFDEFRRVAVKEAKVKEDLVSLAAELFCAWGMA